MNTWNSEMVQALVSPVEKLIEAVSRATGKAYGPKHNSRTVFSGNWLIHSYRVDKNLKEFRNTYAIVHKGKQIEIF